MRLSINNLTRRKAPRLPFVEIARELLPKFENLSVVFVTAAEAKRLNMRLRNKAYTPNVLSYLAGKGNGEIIICLQVAKQQAPEYELSYPDFLLFLFIHGCLHLEGRRHGPTMERREQALLKKLSAPVPSIVEGPRKRNGTKNRNRH